MAASQKGTVDKTQEAEKPTKKVATPEIDVTQDYTVIGTGKSKNLRKGDEYTASGHDVASLIESGKATLKTTDK